MANRVFLHPAWVRIWHWLNALLILLLIVTGFNMHFGGAAVSFRWSVSAHNIAGGLLTLSFVAYIIGLLVSGEWRQYLKFQPGLVKSIVTQSRFYAFGIFRGEPHPTTPTRERKFNVLQQLTYIGIVFIALPVIIVSGGMLLHPENAPDQMVIGSGVWPMAVLHTLVGYAFAAFTLGHIYLTTLGPTPFAYIMGMITGWVEEEHHESAGEHQEHIP